MLGKGGNDQYIETEIFFLILEGMGPIWSNRNFKKEYESL